MSTIQTGAISFEHVSKRYRLGGLGTLRGLVGSIWERNRDENLHKTLWALRDVSFCVAPGEALGLIGPNGAGKTTALKLLSNITQPTEGRIAVGGRLSSLIELGAGFHPELTGRENVYLNGAILGLKQAEIKRKFDEIVAFSELERFIDTPVKRYSSGMYVRLGFAVAAHVEPDVLLVDEVLAVGDASFRHRCIAHMRSLQESGTTLVFISHNMHQVRSVCSSALLLIQGQAHAQGPTSEVITAYEQWLETAPVESESSPGFSDSQGALILRAVQVVQPDEAGNGVLDSHLPLTMIVDYEAIHEHQIGRFDVRILRDDSTLCCTADSSQSANGELHTLFGTGTIEITYAPLQLTTGSYTAVVRVTDVTDSIVVASAQSAPFTVYAAGAGRDRGIYVPKVSWRKLHSPIAEPDGPPNVDIPHP
ncbi:MAG: ATP-binding cassette domain-containing protein [Chloroflexi bacterium]|nr:ATP-binding cassette domain-containing protein [Chloroflexota bacterium]